MSATVAAPTPWQRVKAWLDVRFRSPSAIYGLIVFTTFVTLADDEAHDVAEVLTYLADRFDGLIAGGKPKVRDLYAYEVEHLIGTDSPESIARRLGVKPASLARLLYREQRGDLARHFDDRQERRRKQAA